MTHLTGVFFSGDEYLSELGWVGGEMGDDDYLTHLHLECMHGPTPLKLKIISL